MILKHFVDHFYLCIKNIGNIIAITLVKLKEEKERKEKENVHVYSEG